MAVFHRGLALACAVIGSLISAGPASADAGLESKVWYLPVPEGVHDIRITVANFSGEKLDSNLLDRGLKTIDSIKGRIGSWSPPTRTGAQFGQSYFVIASVPVIVSATGLFRLTPSRSDVSYSLMQEVRAYPIECAGAAKTHTVCSKRFKRLGSVTGVAPDSPVSSQMGRGN